MKMKKRIATTLIVALALAGGAGAGDRATTDEAAEHPADNSGRNVRDRNDATITPGDQSGSEADMELTRKIRKEVVADDSLSTLAHNVKIISIKGVVTLRGPVKSDAERQQIAAVAERFAGAGRVRNDLEIAR
jgi:osmotically-inducible protein OsmY